MNEALKEALSQEVPPPKEFVLAVLKGEIQLPDDIMSEMVDRGWIPRQRCEVWSRVMGYFRPVHQWNAGKKAEYAERKQLEQNEIKEFSE